MASGREPTAVKCSSQRPTTRTRKHRTCTDQRGDRIKNELVMAVIKYSSSFYLQPVINPPVPGFMEMLGRRAQPFDFPFFFFLPRAR